MASLQFRSGPQTVMAAVLIVAFSTAGPAFAAKVPAGEKLFEKYDCSTCHAIDHKVVGPSYVDVAKKFAGQKDAVKTLVAAVENGHVGTWGMVPMPPHPNIPTSQIKEIVEWILTLK